MQMEETSYIQFSIANCHLNLSFLPANVKPNLYDLELEDRGGAYTFSVFIEGKLQFLSVSSAVWLSGWTVAVHTKPLLGWFLQLRLHSCPRTLRNLRSQPCKLPAFTNPHWNQKVDECIKQNLLRALACLSRHLRIWPTENVSHISIRGKVWGIRLFLLKMNVGYSIWSKNVWCNICFQQETLVNSYQSDEMLYSPANSYEKVVSKCCSCRIMCLLFPCF